MNKSVVLKRSISALLCVAMSVSLCTFAGMAEAKTSLPIIEEIKTSDEVFTILEIVPDDTQGSIGYYIDGQEPWVRLTGTKTDKDERETFVTELQGYLNKSSEDEDNNYSLELCNPDSNASDDGYPLTYVGDYTEVYPWEWAKNSDVDYKNYKQMPLKDSETGTAQGYMDYVGLGKGDYTVNFKYVGDGGNYRQKIKEFKTDSEEGEDGYWYNVTFEELEDEDTNIDLWDIIYEEAGEDKDYITVTIGGTQKNLKTVGVVGDRDFPGLNLRKTYYKATWGSACISEEKTQKKVLKNENTLFADLSEGFREVKAGSGDFSDESYEYVGNGNGAYTFTPSGEGTEFKLSTKIVYYTGGFINNNWFLKYVMGYEEDELDDQNVKKPEIHVNTVEAEKVNKAQYDAADMIVLNYGLDITGETFSKIFRNDFDSTDFEDTNLVGLIGTTKKPIIFDYNLISSESTLVKDTAGKLFEKAQQMREGSEFSESAHSFVGGNIYCIDSLGWTQGEGKESVPHSALPLATVNFNNTDSIEGGYLLKEEPFYPVFEEIRYENYLRELRGLSEEEKLSEEITMALAIRYIINYRKIDTKTTVHVLDIEPRTGSIDPEKKGKLAEWLKISQENLIVDTMSTSEFIGIQNDISEEYDILYIGDSAEGFNTRSTTISDFSFTPLPTLKLYNFDYITYNDETMKFNRDSDKSSINKQSVSKYLDDSSDAGWIISPKNSEIVFGMRYTSTGDKVKSGKVKLGDVDYNLSGLLDRDYNEDSTINGNDETRLFRYSGNDLTEVASEKIKDFANSGHTVILANTLLQPPKINDKTIEIANATLRKTNFSARPDISVAGSILKVSLKHSSGLFYLIDSAICKLYKNGETVKDEKGEDVVKTITPFSSVSFDLSNYDYKVGDEFYCTVKITKVRYPLLPILITDPDDSQTGQTATVTIRGNAEDMFVDNSSVMYETINDIVGKSNVMNWTTLDNEVTDIGQTILPRLVNLSKPTIEFWKDRYPTSYEMIDGEMNCLNDDDGDGIYELDYVFRIKNDSDPYPGKTRYKLNLYLDMNGNGLYEEGEVVNDIGLRNWTVYDSYGRAGLRVINGDLLGSYGNERDDQHYYYLTYEIPSNMVGVIPWKLEVIDVNYFGGHDSVTDYTRVVPKEEPDVLQILQIDSTDNKHFSLQENIENGETYKTLLDAVESDFKVNVATIKADFDSNWEDNETSYTTETEAADGTKTSTVKITKQGDEYKKTISIEGEDKDSETYSNITELFESYDMLIIGFGDAYRDLSLDVSKALAEYIDADKPVLMTHDTTSYYSYKSKKSYGYYTNMLIRDRIGMDRYGVTSLKPLSNGKTAGITKYADSDLAGYLKELFGIEEWKGGYVPSNDYYSNGSEINKDRKALLDDIRKAGYSIAWKADKERKQTVSETQGLTNAVLFRFMDVGILDWITGKNVDSYTISYKDSDQNRLGLTTKVTQVNKGQITTYPYDINTEAFGGTGTELDVSETHAQNYQLNMNSDDMIVWYCLSPDTTYGDGIYQKNDVTNAYYIYTCGNVTYTGSGHTTNTINENEAKLFVNTMIAAYRVGRFKSTVSFSNDNGTIKGIESFFVPTDGDTILKLDGVTDNSRNIYFTVNNSNKGEDKYMSVEFSYKEDDLDIPIYEADFNQEVDPNDTLVSTYTYYIKLDDLLSAIGEDVDLNNKLTVTLNTTFNKKDPKTLTTSTASIKLRQNKLFDLS